MTSLLHKILGRLPIGWLQLIYNKARFAAALLGVSFANILIFMQLGFLDSLERATVLPYQILNGNILISPINSNTFSDGGYIPKQRAFQALNVTGVQAAIPIYINTLYWKRDNATSLMLVIAVNPNSKALSIPENAMQKIQLLDYAIIDRKLRNIDPYYFDRIMNGEIQKIELNNRSIFLSDVITLGAGFEADGYLITSDETFWKLFPAITPASPKHILLRLKPGANITEVLDNLKNSVSAYDTKINTIASAIEQDMTYQTTERPVGIVFGFGVFIGLFVGIAIVYQVLSSDVADHLKEYATFKAMGYPDQFFTSIIFEESIILALLGFVPGLIISTILHHVFAHLTDLPMQMTALRAVAVLLGTISFCVASGLIAARKLTKSDPAELF